ncbi:hypothetical protein DWU98_06505 [Dyella monticola]|uniref:Uncharacterized protein n=1 Tax=Dyella monticola TaxID=1927958 RepID=A0A370X331_9GAMM|nr:hypothetical protein DWU98_06505 [Dyella monticola]
MPDVYLSAWISSAERASEIDGALEVVSTPAASFEAERVAFEEEGASGCALAGDGVAIVVRKAGMGDPWMKSGADDAGRWVIGGGNYVLEAMNACAWICAYICNT